MSLRRQDSLLLCCVALSKEKEKEEEKDKEEEKKKKKTRQDDNDADDDDGDGDDVASQLPCLSSVVFLSVCLFLSVFLLIAVHSHRSSIVASLPPRSKAPAQPSRAPWLSPRHLGEFIHTLSSIHFHPYTFIHSLSSIHFYSLTNFHSLVAALSHLTAATAGAVDEPAAVHITINLISYIHYITIHSTL